MMGYEGSISGRERGYIADVFLHASVLLLLHISSPHHHSCLPIPDSLRWSTLAIFEESVFISVHTI